MPCDGLFVIGTDTGVGKTFVSIAIVRRLRELGVRVGVYKPAASGAEQTSAGPIWTDVRDLSAAVNDQFPHDRVCPQHFVAPVAPPVAARLEGRQVDESLLIDGLRWWGGQVDVLIIEGVGGLLSPLSDRISVADFAGRAGFPLLIVGRLGLGTINHTLLSVEAVLRRGLPVAGVVLNQAIPGEPDLAAATNPDELARRLPVPLLGVIPHTSTADLLRLGWFLRMDWRSLMKPSRAQTGNTN
ncbi:MAG: dethiobiotin synthase [Planctomycetales bacterium]|nr:dethiobiotin synthase [Planctomycetales bacterium]